ncbi:hypothetical protein BDR26DRAFT_972551 [Obelidium mucronatum]|nr:hypothetical protein BDR26DRAFT_972551 [Obelidium mucronatum]
MPNLSGILGEYIKKSQVEEIVQKAVLKALGMKDEDDVPRSGEETKGFRRWCKYVDDDLHTYGKRLDELEKETDNQRRENYDLDAAIHGDREHKGLMDRMEDVEEAVFCKNETPDKDEEMDNSDDNNDDDMDNSNSNHDGDGSENEDEEKPAAHTELNEDIAEKEDTKTNSNNEGSNNGSTNKTSGGSVTPVPTSKKRAGDTGNEKEGRKRNALKQAEEAE